MNQFSILAIAHFLFLLVAILAIKNLTLFIRLTKQGEKARFSLALWQKRTIYILCILIYFLVFIFAMCSELEDGNGVIRGLKTGLVISAANTLRFPYSIVAFTLLFLFYHDNKTRKERRGKEKDLSFDEEKQQ